MSGFLSKKERKDLLYELSLEKNLKYAKKDYDNSPFR